LRKAAQPSVNVGKQPDHFNGSRLQQQFVLPVIILRIILSLFSFYFSSTVPLL
jgi:hypothetical protein